jgi:hypothetical protein
MRLNTLNRSFSGIFQNQKTSWHLGLGSQLWLNREKVQRQGVQPTTLLQNPGKSEACPELRVESIEVSSDRKYMYCKGCVRSQGTGSKSNVVIAVEWLDKDRKAINTDWKRVEMHLDDETAPLLSDTLQSFLVRTTLDRRVKWVKAYAFSGNQ